MCNVDLVGHTLEYILKTLHHAELKYSLIFLTSSVNPQFQERLLLRNLFRLSKPP